MSGLLAAMLFSSNLSSIRLNRWTRLVRSSLSLKYLNLDVLIPIVRFTFFWISGVFSINPILSSLFLLFISGSRLTPSTFSSLYSELIISNIVGEISIERVKCSILVPWVNFESTISSGTCIFSSYKNLSTSPLWKRICLNWCGFKFNFETNFSFCFFLFFSSAKKTLL